MQRKDPNLTEKLCAMILLHFKVPHEVGRGMTREQILALVGQWDHYPIPVSLAVDSGWTPEQYNHPANLQPLAVDIHAVKTAKQDIPQIAKTKRITKKQEAFASRLLAKTSAVENVAKTTISRRLPSQKMRKVPEGHKFNWRTGKIERVEASEQRRARSKIAAD